MKKETIVLPEQKKVIAVIYSGIGKFRGVAKCNPEDEWDEDFGKKLAMARAETKYVVKQTHNLHKKFDQNLREIAILINRNSKIADMNNAWMDKYFELRNITHPVDE